MLPLTLPSLLNQDFGRYEVVVADDGSSDGTAELAMGLAEETGGSVAVVICAPKPTGWAGKVHAQQCGLDAILGRGAVPEWTLLSDADIRHPDDSLSSLIAQAQRGGYDMVSVMARLHAGSFWERLLIPPFVFFFNLLYPFRSVRHRSSEVAAAAGGCVLVRTAALVEAGGFAAIQGELIDDVALARLLKSHHRQLWLGFDPQIESVRPYRSLAELWDMVARSAFVQLGYRYWLVPPVALGLAIFFVGPPVLALAGFAAHSAIIVLLSLAAWLLQAFHLYPYGRHHRVPAVYSFLLPLASAFYAAMTVSSAWRHLLRQGSRWKERDYGSPE